MPSDAPPGSPSDRTSDRAQARIPAASGQRRRQGKRPASVTLALSFAILLVIAAAGTLAYGVLRAPTAKQPLPTVTVTMTARPQAAATVTVTPRRTVTQYIDIASTGGSSGWAPIASVAALIAALGTAGIGLGAWRRDRSDKPARQPDKRTGLGMPSPRSLPEPPKSNLRTCPTSVRRPLRRVDAAGSPQAR